MDVALGHRAARYRRCVAGSVEAMTDPFVAGAASAGLFGIYADLAYTLYGATNSSPQTTELFAADRAKTLSKYVYLGHAQALGYGLFG